MELEKQVVNLELSKRLKELGVKQDSIWWWVLLEGYFDYQLVRPPIGDKEIKDCCRAFTVAELFGKSMDETSLEKATDGENTYYICKLDIKSGLKFTDRNPANALAKMKIYLIENNLIK